jgi:hypothetical protein
MAFFMISHLLTFTQEQQRAFSDFVKLGYDLMLACKRYKIIARAANIGIEVADCDAWHNAGMDLYFIRVASSLYNSKECNFSLSGKQVGSLKTLLDLAVKLQTWYAQLPAREQDKNAYQKFVVAMDGFYKTAKQLVDTCLASVADAPSSESIRKKI